VDIFAIGIGNKLFAVFDKKTLIKDVVKKH
jgi:hypothetical protein